MNKPPLTPLLATTLDEWKRRGWTPEFLASLRMEEDPPNDPPADPPKSDDPPADPPKSEPISFTPEQQKHIDDLISKQHGKAKSAAEKEFKTWLDQQAMSENDRIKAESAAKDDEVKAARTEAMTAKVETTAERLAITAGVKPDRVEKFLKLVDLNDLEKLTDDGKPDKDAIKALIDAELADAPEFKGTSSGGTGKSGGEFDAKDGKVWTRSEISKMTPAEYEKHEESILAQLAKGGIK